MTDAKVINWLLDSDPSIRWQVLPRWQEPSEKEIAREREKVATQGWGTRLLAYQDSAGRWGGQLYNNKWLSTTYTLMLLRQMGLESGNHRAQRVRRTAGRRFPGRWQHQLWKNNRQSRQRSDRHDPGAAGLFHFPDERVHVIAAYLLAQQLPDGRWEPVTDNRQLKYTFDGTLLILDSLHEYEKRFPAPSRTSCRGTKKRP